MIAIDDALPAGGAAGELDGRLDRFRAAVTEEDARQVFRCVFGQHLGDQAAQQAAIHPNQVGHILAHDLLKDRLHFGMIPPQRENAPAGEQIEVFIPLGVPKVGPFAADVALVEADGLENLYEGGVDVLGMEVVTPVRSAVPASARSPGNRINKPGSSRQNRNDRHQRKRCIIPIRSAFAR